MIKVIKIFAIGSYKRFAWFELPNGNVYCSRISDDFYYQLKLMGVPTVQSMRKKN